MVSVHNVRQMGYSVDIHHVRNYDKNGVISCRGGITEVDIYKNFVLASYRGVSLCNDKDNYNKKLGVRIALGRAMKLMGIPRKNHKNI